jgi:hypothetical protein
VGIDDSLTPDRADDLVNGDPGAAVNIVEQEGVPASGGWI